MDDRRRVRFSHSDPPAGTLPPAVLEAIAALLEPRREVQEARVSKVTKTFDDVEVGWHLVLAIWLFDPPNEAGDPQVQALTMDLIRPLVAQTGIGGVSVPSAIARQAFESQGVTVFSRE